MNVEIQEVTSTVRAVDSQSLLSPQILERIVSAVVQAIRDGGERDERAAAERRITGGVNDEREGRR
jgi:hypothetical protein